MWIKGKGSEWAYDSPKQKELFEKEAKISYPYPDTDLIKRLRVKFIEFGVKELSRDEVIDLINHQHELIRDLKREAIVADRKNKFYSRADNSIYRQNISMNEYQRRAAITDISPGKEVINPPWLYYMLKLSGEVGELSEKVGKVFRDKRGNFNANDVRLIKKELGDILWYLSRIASAFGYGLGFIALYNLSKLARREKRGTLGGSGDDR
ncbi:MAG: nucleoside triphosphate pyrophosphohydrolase family protein [Actinomycetia bacterium]|nr:nucleoside triphosphate pyrophosphohydrolase family protein [Actinomycetes bacterium]